MPGRPFGCFAQKAPVPFSLGDDRLHELSLAQAVWRQVGGEMEKHAGACLVALEVTVGRFSGADPEAFEFALRLLAEDSPWPDAEVRLRTEPVRLLCRTCARRYETETLDLACPGCGGYDVEVTGGRDLRLESLEIQEDDGETHSA